MMMGVQNVTPSVVDSLGRDIVDALGYQNGSRDINRHVDEEDRQKYAVWKDLDKQQNRTLNKTVH